MNKDFKIGKIKKLYISHITDEINEKLVNNEVEYKFNYKDLRNFFEEKELIRDYIPTTLGLEYGIEISVVTNERGTF